MDPKVKNLIKFIITRFGTLAVIIYGYFKYSGERDPVRFVGTVVLAVAAWRGSLSIYRRVIKPAKKPASYGKWAIVTGTTSGIGKEFVRHLAQQGLSLLIISRSEDKLKEQVAEITTEYHVSIRYMVYDYCDLGPARTKFYDDLKVVCSELDADGGLGILINNVGIANEIPRRLEEFSDSEVDNIINCNIFSTVSMTRTVLPFMQAKKKGAIISVSSGSGNHPGPFLAIYSATKAFMTQFSRSMHVECWDCGVDFLVVTPFYVVSNLYKRSKGTLIAPMPDKLVQGTFSQLGKKFVWQEHGYWFHGVIGNFSHYYWGMAERYRKMMVDNRKRYDERQASKKQN